MEQLTKLITALATDKKFRVSSGFDESLALFSLALIAPVRAVVSVATNRVTSTQFISVVDALRES